MQALEFSTVLNPDLQIEIPQDYRMLLKASARLRVIILVEDEAEESHWNAMAAQALLDGYDEADSIYDKL
jgi:hypothetical protein